MSRPSTDLRIMARAASRVLGIGTVALLGAVLVHGAPSVAELRRGACAVVGCAVPTDVAEASRAARLAVRPPAPDARSRRPE